MAAILDEETGKEQIEMLRREWGSGRVLQVGPSGYRADRRKIAGYYPAVRFCAHRHWIDRFSGGGLSAVKKDSIFDTGGKMLAILGQSAPTFAVGLILMWVFAVQLDPFPISGKGASCT